MKNPISYSIDGIIFEQQPGYRRGLVWTEGLRNGRAPTALTAMLRQAESDLRQRLQADALAEHERLKPWRDAFRCFGAKPGKYRPSHEAMIRRTLRGDALPSINALVDLGNAVALQHMLPIGCHALDEVKGELALRVASGTELFTPFGSNMAEHPEAGEIIFAEGDEVLTRRWVWRQAVHTLTLPTSRNIVFNIDALRPVGNAELLLVMDQLGDLICRFCGGSTASTVLSAENPSVQLKPVSNMPA